MINTIHQVQLSTSNKLRLRTISRRTFQAHEQLSVGEDDGEHQEAQRYQSLDKREGISQEGDEVKLQIGNHHQ